MEDRHGVSARVIMRMIEEALSNNWELPEDVSARVPEYLLSVVNDPEESTRNRINASNALAKIREQRTEALSKAAKWAIDFSVGQMSEALAHLPPADGESMVDDTPKGVIER